ncbi:MAG: hypothetical protein K0Q71_3033 [Thermomicrobiales bacterium]|nr:hypothetical protein [Thermomicrobiales bacterium]
MQSQGWRQRARALAKVGSRPLIAALLIAPALSLAFAQPVTHRVSAQDVGTEDFNAPRFNQTITILDNGPASPYGSTVNIDGLDGGIIDVNLILLGVDHQRPEDISVMLQHSGRTAVVMRDAGGETALRNTNITLDQAAAETLPNNDPILGNRAYQPRDFDPADPPTPFGGGAPGVTDTDPREYLDIFNGVTANGAWTVWIRDDQAPIGGSLDGWQLEITTDNTEPYIEEFRYKIRQDRTLRVAAGKGLLRHVENRENFDVKLVDGPRKGKLKLHSDGSFTYEPKGNKKGKDSFTYLIEDEFGTSISGNGNVKIKIKKNKRRR